MCKTIQDIKYYGALIKRCLPPIILIIYSCGIQRLLYPQLVIVKYRMTEKHNFPLYSWREWLWKGCGIEKEIPHYLWMQGKNTRGNLEAENFFY